MGVLVRSGTPLIVFFLILLKASSETAEVRQSLVQFMDKLNPGNRDANFGWNLTSDPCISQWKGVGCVGSSFVNKIVLDQFNLSGILDARSLCMTKHFTVFSLSNNNVGGTLPAEIANCSSLTHLYVSGNNFTGTLPVALPSLRNLKRLYVSNNGFSGELPNLSAFSGLITFGAEYNQFVGELPEIDSNKFDYFNVSFNNLSGRIPDGYSNFGSSSFIGNPGLCGPPLSNACPPTSA